MILRFHHKRMSTSSFAHELLLTYVFAKVYAVERCLAQCRGDRSGPILPELMHLSIVEH